MRQPIIIGLLILSVSACDQCDVMGDPNATTDERYLALAQAQYPPFPLLNEKPGQGALARWGGRHKLELSIQKPRAKTQTLAAFEFEFPPVKERYRGPKLSIYPFSGQYPAELGTSILGMRVGGERQVKINGWTPIISGQQQGLLIGMKSKNQQQLQLKDWKNATLKIKLIETCQPRYCLRTTYSIPSMRDQKLVERGCS